MEEETLETDEPASRSVSDSLSLSCHCVPLQPAVEGDDEEGRVSDDPWSSVI